MTEAQEAVEKRDMKKLYIYVVFRFFIEEKIKTARKDGISLTKIKDQLKQ